MPLHLIALGFPEWQPHFSFLDTPQANEMMALRWLHLIFGIIWIGLLYFFNLVLTPAMKKCDPKLRIKIYPELMPGAMGWFRWSALVTVLSGCAITPSISLPTQNLRATLSSLESGSAGGSSSGSSLMFSSTPCNSP